MLPVIVEPDQSYRRTATSIRALDREAMVDELARLLGGAEITETVRQNAEEMKRLAKKRKLEV